MIWHCFNQHGAHIDESDAKVLRNMTQCDEIDDEISGKFMCLFCIFANIDRISFFQFLPTILTHHGRFFFALFNVMGNLRMAADHGRPKSNSNSGTNTYPIKPFQCMLKHVLSMCVVYNIISVSHFGMKQLKPNIF